MKDKKENFGKTIKKEEQKMNFPTFYDQKKIGSLYLPDTFRAEEEGTQAGLKPAIKDKKKILLINVDFQVDFVFKNAGLPVPGAEKDIQRTIEWIFRNTESITTILSSLDTHLLFQIFFREWFIDENGKHPDPFTLITEEDIRNGKWKAVIDPAWTAKYINQEKMVMIWPYHTMEGTPGRALVPALYEAIIYHGAARLTQPLFLDKGRIPKTEYFSIFEPRVKVKDHPQGGLNTAMLDIIASHDLTYIAGEAKSHCVLDSMRSIVDYFAGQKEVLEKIRFLVDCTSSVVHPDIDFEAIANAELAEMEKKGIQLVKSTDPIG